MTPDRQTLELIDQLGDVAGLSEAHDRRLAALHQLIVAGGTLTTYERAEVVELWNRYVRFPQHAQGGDHGNATSQ